MSVFIGRLFDIMWICALCRCQHKKMWDVRVLLAREKQILSVQKMSNIQTYRYADRLSNTDTRAETYCTYIHTNTQTHWHTTPKHTFYTQKLVQRRFYTPTLLQQRNKQTLFTHRSFYTQALLYTNTFCAHKSFYTQKRLHRETFYTQTCFFTQTFFAYKRLTHRYFSARQLLQTANFYTHKTLHTNPFSSFTYRSFYKQQAFRHSNYTKAMFFIQALFNTFTHLIYTAGF